MKYHEVKVVVPDGFQLVGARSEGDVVVIVYREAEQVRPIGFVQHTDISPLEIEDE